MIGIAPAANALWLAYRPSIAAAELPLGSTSRPGWMAAIFDCGSRLDVLAWWLEKKPIGRINMTQASLSGLSLPI